MHESRRVLGSGLVVGFLLAVAESTAHGQAASPRMAARQPDLLPSVIGGDAKTLSVYNFSKRTAKVFWVDPTGTIQLVPDGATVPPTSGDTPFELPTFVGATVGFQLRPRGGGKWIHLTGAREKPFIVLGNPPDEFRPAEEAVNAEAKQDKKEAGARKRRRNDPTGDYDASAFQPGTRVAKNEGNSPNAAKTDPNTTPNNTTTNNTTVNNPRRRRRPRAGTGTGANITIEPAAPIFYPAASDGYVGSGQGGGADAANPDSPPAAAPDEVDPVETKPESKGKKRFTAESPVIVEFLKIHNTARAEVGVDPLEWSTDLANSAHRWAAHIARTGRFEHMPDSRYGENIAVGDGDDFNPATAANEWLEEKALYDHDAPEPPIYRVSKMYKDDDGEVVIREYDSDRAHYTQMIWGKTTQVGVGTARMKNGDLVVVALYNPPGNVRDQKPY